MTEPQTWVLLGIFATVMLGGMTLMATLINRATVSAVGELRGELSGDIRGLRGEMTARFEAVDARFEAVDARFEVVNARFEAAAAESRAEFSSIKKSLENLDTDVAVLTRRAWDDPNGR